MSKKIFFFLLLSASTFLFAQKQRNFLTKQASVSGLENMLANNDKWITYPAYENRTQWDNITGSFKQDLIKNAERALHYQFQFIPASSYLAYAKTGDRGIQENPYGQNLNAVKNLALGELAEGKGRFIPQLIKGIDNLCAMQTWALSAHLGGLQHNRKEGVIDSSENVIDLGAGRTASVLAWTYYFLHNALDKENSGFSQKIASEIERRIIEPYESRSDFWWMALQHDKFVNNWNVWCNYNVLTCILLIEKSQQRKAGLVYKTMQSVDKFLNYYKDDGACEEGPSYWSEAGGNLYHYLNLLSEATGNKINIFNEPLVKNIAAYIYKVYIDKGYFVNFADAHPNASPDGGLLYDFGKAVNDDTLQSFGAWISPQKKFPRGDFWDDINYLSEYPKIKSYPGKQPFPANVEFPETQIAIARDKNGSPEGFFFAAKGGNNNESHNHNDVGSFILYYNGNPLFIDIGSGTYTAQTFSRKRYELFNTRSLNHNIPLINGIEQHVGENFKSSDFKYSADNRKVNVSIGIEKAYPDSASVNKWERGYTLERGKIFSIKDEFDLKINNGNCTNDFITPVLPVQISPGELEFDVNGTKLYMKFDANLLHYNQDTITISDPAIIHQWGITLYRVELNLDKKILNGNSIVTISKNK
ncbi:MAG: heparinase II/III family protein [Arachidicoccus sp.]|nr:heparinase II/III family protein [Arachidicoccus sp.]